MAPALCSSIQPASASAHFLVEPPFPSPPVPSRPHRPSLALSHLSPPLRLHSKPPNPPAAHDLDTATKGIGRATATLFAISPSRPLKPSSGWSRRPPTITTSLHRLDGSTSPFSSPPNPSTSRRWTS
ncbi:hypothetical protein M011DRAFT_471715 [Sporormia fimetaria CBS 119925]|uniref:Uncharacterized protein n=1 Tax=Sporormia fimetaria CBS 119925 TaxID=1340428 RepID=A0A6A6V006_9PLEO|nr:hypothetical protein M011DRAFT_471715 [Sporormia fimetaria CBS 119925]